MDWLHCNKCFTQENQNMFVFSNCSHIYCYKCHQTNRDFCFSCEKQCKFVKIDDNMSPNLRPIFTEISNSVESLKRTLTIQMAQRSNLLEFYKNKCTITSKKYDCVKKYYTEIRIKYKKKDDECKQLEHELERLKLENNRFRNLAFMQQNTVVRQSRKQTKQSKQMKQTHYLKNVANMTVVSEASAPGRTRSPTSFGGFGPYYPQFKKRL